MTVQRRPHVGFEVRCDARYCKATTATLAPTRFRRTSTLAEEAARLLLWLPVRISGATYWVCPLQQVLDPRLERWVPIGGIVQVAS